MEMLMKGWCHLIGINDVQAIETATGVVAGGIALLIGAVFGIWVLDLAEAALNRRRLN